MNLWYGTALAAHPQRIALSDPGRGIELSYRELDGRVRAAAAWLRREHRIEPGDRIGLLAQNRVEYFTLLFAAERIGAVFVPLNWRLAAAELCAITRLLRPSLIICEDDLAASVREADAPVVSIAAVPIEGAADERSAFAQNATAMILCTSGTSGLPRGAKLSWRQLRFNAEATASACALGPDDSTLAMLPLFHTGALNVFATPLLRLGGRVVLMREFDAAAALDCMATERITTLVAVPTLYQSLLPGFAERSWPQLRWLLVGGAPCPAELLDAYRDLGLHLRQGYGSTEVGPNCFSFAPLDAPTTVGTPMPGTEARLTDAEGQVVDGAGTGELWLRGPHVTTGYFGDAESSRAALRGGWFRTGDLMARDERGLYRSVGRVKEMFISGGENVYPAEVESALLGHPDVAEVAVVGVPDERWGEVGRASLVLRRGAELDSARLRAYLRTRVAGYKIPKQWTALRELPRNATGKVLKAALVRLDGNSLHQ